jgi:hypothetical protein
MTRKQVNPIVPFNTISHANLPEILHNGPYLRHQG